MTIQAVRIVSRLDQSGASWGFSTNGLRDPKGEPQQTQPEDNSQDCGAVLFDFCPESTHCDLLYRDKNSTGIEHPGV
jgi:hypothetical protein